MEKMKIKEIATVISGSTPKTNIEEYWDGKLLWVTPAEIIEKDMYIYDTQRKITEEGAKSSSLKILPKNTVLLTSRAPIGKVAIAGEEMYCNQGFKNLICDENIVKPKYMYYWLSSKKEYLNSLGRGATFKEVSKQIIENIEVPIQSIDSQEKIINILDKAQQLIDKRQEQIKELNELVKSRFIDKFGNVLTNDREWNFLKIQEFAEIVSGSTPKTNVEEYWDGDEDWITPAELNEKSFIVNESARKITKEAIKSTSLKQFPRGTVILSSRAPIGKVAIAGKDMYCNQGFKNLICDDRVNPIYMYWLLKQQTNYLNSLGRGATFKEISKSIVGEIKVSVPPIELQNEFADFVKQVDKLKAKMEMSIDELQENFNSLMQRAFNGEI